MRCIRLKTIDKITTITILVVDTTRGEEMDVGEEDVDAETKVDTTIGQAIVGYMMVMGATATGGIGIKVAHLRTKKKLRLVLDGDTMIQEMIIYGRVNIILAVEYIRFQVIFILLM